VRRLALSAAVVLVAGARVEPGELTATFIGNSAFHVTDGEVAILADFPYLSGAFGYMQWSPAQVPKRPSPLCLFTHGHRDHFAPDQVPAFCDIVVGPALAAREGGVRTLALEKAIRWKGLTIRAIATPHASVEHVSYLVEWQGQRLYFSGDTQRTEELLESPDLDVAFVNPWLLEAVAKAGARVDARLIVMCHHKPGSAVPPLSNGIVPTQGQVLTLPSRSGARTPPNEGPDSSPIPAAPRTAEEAEFVARWGEAERNVLIPGAGRDFMNGPFTESFFRSYPTRISECAERTGEKAVSDFDAAIQLAADGRVLAAIVRPRSKLATCFAESLTRDALARPPFEGFWVPVGIKLSKP
jgi:L-ascorbate metabolism protein UlaG (beta-lactamase superfamily)